MPEEIRISEVLKGIGKKIEEMREKAKKEKILTSEDIVHRVEDTLKKVLPEPLKELKAEWQDPNKVIVEFLKARFKEKKVKVLEAVE